MVGGAGSARRYLVSQGSALHWCVVVCQKTSRCVRG